MKNIFLTVTLVLISFVANAQLNANGNTVKAKMPEQYNQIKLLASQDWEGDHKMMVYVINDQCDALMELSGIINGKEYDEKIMLNAFTEWTESINGESCIDYKMALYVYKQQFNSKGTY